MRLKNRVAIVTGSTRGIGEETLRLFHKEGAKVVITGRDEARGLAITKELIKEDTAKRSLQNGIRSLFIKTDVSIRDDVLRLASKTLATFGSIDILVNNAGLTMPSPFESLPEDTWDETMHIVLKSVYYCSQIIGQTMIKQNSGVILNIASISAHFAFPDAGAYGPAKAAVIMLSKQCAMEWAKYNIRVNSISPGLIRTPMMEEIYQDAEKLYRRLQMIPLGRIGTPKDVASVALFLCFDEASYITAQDIRVDGGLTDNVLQKVPRSKKAQPT